jgi:hypothetical protein
MPTTKPTSLIELQTDVWKSRAQAKLKWLERTLAEPARTPQESKHQSVWIQQALIAIRRAQDEIKYQLALMDVYTAHLGALEMTLMSASEERAREGGGSKRGE